MTEIRDEVPQKKLDFLGHLIGLGHYLLLFLFI